LTKRIAIIGGGIAGLYTAWRLVGQHEDQKNVDQATEDKETESFVVHIYEKESSFGGRIRSQKIEPLEFGAELGAMRFRRSHLLLNALIAKLKISTCDFKFPPAVLYVRGRRLNSGEITQGHCWTCNSGGPFHLRPSEQGKSAVELVKYAITQLLTALNFPKLHQSKARQLKRKIKNEDYDQQAWYYIKSEGTYQGLHLYQIGFWNLLQHFLSNEAYVMVHEVLSLQSILGNWNAAEAIPWFLDDFASDEYQMVSGGLSRVADALTGKLSEATTSDDGGEIKRKNVEVKKIIRTPTGWKIHGYFDSRNKDNGEEDNGDKERIPVERTLKEYEDTYDDVILALPLEALEKLTVDPGDGPLKWPPYWLNWVEGHRMIKIFLLYAEPWWMGDAFPGSDTGRIFTDLPLRQIYHFSPTWMQAHGSPQSKSTDEEGLALVMASYSDEHYVSFWEPMLRPNPEWNLTVTHDQPYIQPSPKLPPEMWEKIKKTISVIRTKSPHLLARRRMVEKVHLMLEEIHGREIPHPVLGMAQDWNAGWHTWIVGSRPWEKPCRHERVQPLDHLYLCGEAYSPEQGWIEGALKSAEQVLEKMKVARPEWLEKLHVKWSRYIDPYNWLDLHEENAAATDSDGVDTAGQVHDTDAPVDDTKDPVH